MVTSGFKLLCLCVCVCVCVCVCARVCVRDVCLYISKTHLVCDFCLQRLDGEIHLFRGGCGQTLTTPATLISLLPARLPNPAPSYCGTCPQSLSQGHCCPPPPPSLPPDLLPLSHSHRQGMGTSRSLSWEPRWTAPHTVSGHKQE